MKRTLVVLAIGAALLGAPLDASAAANTLTDPSASPMLGTTDTTFRLRVRYDGRFPALAVRVDVAGRTETMERIDGSPASGTWQSTLRLPAGSWPTRFHASSERGGDPAVSGPTLTVAGGSAPTPIPTPSAPAASPDPSGGAGGSGGPGNEGHAPVSATPPPAGPSDEASAPTEPSGDSGATHGGADATPASGGAPAFGSGTGAGAPTSTVAGPADADDRPASPDTASGSVAPTSSIAGPDESGPRAVPRATGGGSGLTEPPTEPPGQATLSDDELVLASTRVAAAWLAGLLAMIAIGLGVLARRRRQEAARMEAAIAAAEADRILRQRAVRAARRRLEEDDPVVASAERRSRLRRTRSE